MGQKPSSTSLYNEYQYAYNISVEMINAKLPAELERLKKLVEFFEIFKDTNLSQIEENFVFLERQKPFPFTSNVYLKNISMVNSKEENLAQIHFLKNQLNVETTINNNGNVSNYKKKQNNQNKLIQENPYLALEEWGREMFYIFKNMLKNIEKMSIQINAVYPYIYAETYQSVKQMLEIYSDYIYRIHLFINFKGDLFKNSQVLTKWKSQEVNTIQKYDTLYQNILRFSPPQVEIRPDLPSVTMSQTTAPPPIIDQITTTNKDLIENQIGSLTKVIDDLTKNPPRIQEQQQIPQNLGSLVQEANKYLKNSKMQQQQIPQNLGSLVQEANKYLKNSKMQQQQIPQNLGSLGKFASSYLQEPQPQKIGGSKKYRKNKVKFT
jgi:hypothetical protein